MCRGMNTETSTEMCLEMRIEMSLKIFISFVQLVHIAANEMI